MSATFDSFLGLHLKFHGLASKTTEIPGGKIHYYQYQGNPDLPTLVVVHGIGSNSTHFGRVLVALKKAGYPLLAIDLPSHGLSSDLAHPLTAEALHQSLEDWIHAVLPRDKKFVLVGNSLGGALCLRFSLNHPHRVERMVVSSPAGGFESEDEWQSFREGVQFKTLKDSQSFMKRLYHRHPFYLPVMYYPFFLSMTRKGVQELLHHASVKDFQVEPEAEFSSLPPMLFVWGKEEKVFSEKNLEWFKRVLPKTTVFEHPDNVGHCPHLEKPEWFVPRMLDFLKKGEAR